MEKKIKPLKERVVVEPFEQEEMTSGGIYIPDIAKERPSKGRIVAAGEETIVKVGDTVIYGKYSGTEFKFFDKDYLIMNESDIFAIIKEE